MTQVGWRWVQKVWRWAKALGVKVRHQKDMGSLGTNHDITPPSKVQHPDALAKDWVPGGGCGGIR